MPSKPLQNKRRGVSINQNTPLLVNEPQQVRKHDFDAIKRKLASDDLTIADFKMLDQQYGESIFHCAAKRGDVDAFYNLINKYIELSDEKSCRVIIDKISPLLGNYQFKTPWHYAAENGYDQFFKMPTQEEHKKIWREIVRAGELIGRHDINGKSVAHYAAHYGLEESSERIHNRKRVISALAEIEEVDFGHKDQNGRTALASAIPAGCFETVNQIAHINQLKRIEKKYEKELKAEGKGKEKQNASNAAEAEKEKKDYEANLLLAEENGRQNTAAALTIAFNMCNLGSKKNAAYTKEFLLKAAQNKNTSNEKFEECLKKADKNLTVSDIKDVIDARLKTMRNKFFNGAIRDAVFKILCPTIAVAIFFSMVLSFFSVALLDPIATAFTFLAFGAAFSYASYKTRMNDYTRLTSETLFMTWLSGRLLDCKDGYEDLFKQAVLLSREISQCKSPEELVIIDAKFLALQQSYSDKNKELEQVITFDAGKKPKIKLQYLPQNILKDIKTAAQHDYVNNEDWLLGWKPLGILKLKFMMEVLCPLSAVLEIEGEIHKRIPPGSDVDSFFDQLSDTEQNAGKVAGTIILFLLFSWLLKGPVYTIDKAEQGEDRRNLHQAFINLKGTMLFTGIQTKYLNKLENALEEKRRNLKSP
ncbi:MAG: hypothetical protein A3F12_07625 [Gammaproteobacteria bacterium RIFCSPHIGHO2_12_FULL_38_14]|nr:MAG: hypothetical protein A3F12_07625 [Gammaproteobacteria bacterium RIFCSPHIGHO2_12_FULL_38_14]